MKKGDFGPGVMLSKCAEFGKDRSGSFLKKRGVTKKQTNKKRKKEKNTQNDIYTLSKLSVKKKVTKLTKKN